MVSISILHFESHVLGLPMGFPFVGSYSFVMHYVESILVL